MTGYSPPTDGITFALEAVCDLSAAGDHLEGIRWGLADAIASLGRATDWLRVEPTEL